MSNVVHLADTADRIAATGVLLHRTFPVLPPQSSTVYALSGGRVGVAPLSRYRLPASLRGSTLVSAADDCPPAVAFLPVLAEIADRVAPWVRVHIAPRVLTHRAPGDDYAIGREVYTVGGREYSTCGGLACRDQGLILMCLRAPSEMASTLVHEAMHFFWPLLNDEGRAAFDTATDRGPAWPGRYFGSREEQACRLAQHQCSAYLHGATPPDRPPGLVAESIVDALWSGELANIAIKNGSVDVPHDIMARRGLLPPPPPLLVRAARAAWRAVAA